MDQHRERVLAFFDEIAFCRFLGMKAEAHDDGSFSMRLPFREELVGDPFRPALHGGVLSSLIDTAGGGAAFLAIDEGQKVSTVDMSVDYLRPAPLEELVATARVIRRGNRVVLTAVEVKTAQTGDVIAVGRAVFNIHGPRAGT